MTVAGPGMSGFSEGPELVAGTVRGIRTWELVCGAHFMPPVLALIGANYHRWDAGPNQATCFAVGRTTTEVNPGHCRVIRTHGDVPDKYCGCGFWAYWNLSMAWGSVAGVIEGYGKTILGDKGFRCQKARILALAFRPLSTVGYNKEGAARLLSQRFDVPVFLNVDLLLAKFPTDSGGLI